MARRLLPVLFCLTCPAGVMMLSAAGPPSRKPLPRPLAKVEEHSGFYVIGLARRTNNARELAGQGEIAKVWQEFSDKHLADKITHALGDDLFAVYTDYEGDQNGDYTFLLGKKVSGLSELSAGLTGRHVPSGRYAMLTSQRGPLSEVVPKLWQRIWAMPPLGLGGKRAFEADYELYDQRAKDPNNAQVDIYVSLQ
jgi:predicted transcriptional regulator YdeE